MKIVVDVMGGDDAPQVVLDGVGMALAADPDLQLILTGPAAVTANLVAKYPERLSARATTEVIAMDEHPAEAVRAKKDSSIVVGCQLVANGQASGFFSAGSTGAVMAAATLYMGRIKGIIRPMIATLFPTRQSYVVFGDIGANADVKPEYLLQFALMGRAYAQAMLGVEQPRIGLLNIGSEASKGSEMAQQAYQLFSENLDGFAGNAEGNDILTGHFDVIVTDGFTGNVVLKTTEGTVSMLFSELKQTFMSSLPRKLAAAVLKPGLRQMMQRLSPENVGGAPLLGVRGACIIGHGSSTPTAIMNGIQVTAQMIRAELPEVIAQAVLA